jgi:hypothetical protein
MSLKGDDLRLSNHAVIVLRPDHKIEQLVKEIVNHPQKQLILEVSEDVSLLTNEINLRLIKFYAEDEGKELIINGVDPLLITLAQRLGISTIRERNFGSTDLDCREEAAVLVEPAEEPNPIIAKGTPAPIRTNKNRRRYHWSWSWQSWRSWRSLLPAIGIAFFSLVIAVWLFFQPKAVVVLYPKEQKLNFGAKVLLGTAFREKDIMSGKIPGKMVEKTATITIRTVATGKKTIGVTPARGKIILINRSNQPVVVPKGTVVFGERGFRFKTTTNVLAPKKATRLRFGIPVGEEYGKVQVGIVAAQNGTSGNQPGGRITRMESRFQNYLRVINTEPTVNGTDKQIPVVSAVDVEKGQNEARKQMQLAAPEEIAAMVGEGFLLFPELIRIEIISLNSSPAVSSETRELKTILKYRTTAMLGSSGGVHKFLLAQMAKNTPTNFEAKNHDVKLVSAQVISDGPKTVRIHLVGTGTLRGVLCQEKIRALIRGKSLAEAREILTEQDEVADYRIRMNPAKRERLPGFGFQIKILFPAGVKGKVR